MKFALGLFAGALVLFSVSYVLMGHFNLFELAP